MTEETQAPEPEPTIEPGEGFSEEGNLVTRALLYDEHTNKQFITVQTAGGNTFYIVIDYEKMMQQKPRPQAPAPAKPPRGSRCSGCPYWRGIGCVPCYRELMRAPAGGR